MKSDDAYLQSLWHTEPEKYAYTEEEILALESTTKSILATKSQIELTLRILDKHSDWHEYRIIQNSVIELGRAVKQLRSLG